MGPCVRRDDTLQSHTLELHYAPGHYSASNQRSTELIMGRYLLLWMLGIPLPILVLIYMFGGLN